MHTFDERLLVHIVRKEFYKYSRKCATAMFPIRIDTSYKDSSIREGRIHPI